MKYILPTLALTLILGTAAYAAYSYEPVYQLNTYRDLKLSDGDVKVLSFTQASTTCFMAVSNGMNGTVNTSLSCK